MGNRMMHRITDEDAARMIREADERDNDALRKSVARYDAHMDRLNVPNADDEPLWVWAFERAAEALFLATVFLACFVVMP